MKPSHTIIMRMAHTLQKNVAHCMPNSHKQTPQTWSDMLRLAWYFARLRKAFENGIVTFSYWKKDDSIREAKGTLCFDIIPPSKHPKSPDTPLTKDIVSPSAKYRVFTYYDLDKEEWRSFDLCRFIGFVTFRKLIESKINDPSKKKGDKRKEPKEN